MRAATPRLFVLQPSVSQLLGAERSVRRPAARAWGADSRPALRARWTCALGAALLLVSLVGAAPTARADEHDPERAAHPVRIVAYALHPIGVVLDYLIVRPAHWVVEREPFRTLFGHQD